MDNKPIVRMQVTLNATAERAWAALTASDALEAWFAEHAAVDLANGRYDFWGQYTAGVPDREGGHHPLQGCEAGPLVGIRLAPRRSRKPSCASRLIRAASVASWRWNTAPAATGTKTTLRPTH